MATVTALERQKRNQDRVNVYLDGEFAFGLNERDAAALQTGQQLTDEDIQALRDRDAIVKAVDRAVRLLTLRPRSIHEVQQALQDQDIPQPVVDAAIHRLLHLGYLDDEAFARFWVENRNTFKPRSTRALRYELWQKGVPDATITQVLDEATDDEAAAYDALRQRIRRYEGKPLSQFRQKAGAFLQRRGFAYGTIRDVLARVIDEVQAEQADFFSEEPPA